jgi:hypothetical protein
VKAVALEAVPPGVVTDTLTRPAVPDGVLAVILVPDVETTIVVAGDVAKVTPAVGESAVPEIVTVVPPASGPLVGERCVTVGALK